MSARPPSRGPDRRRSIIAVVVLGSVLVIAAAWIAWPQEWQPTLRSAMAAAQRWRESSWAPLAVLAGFAAGGFIVFPVNLLVAATIVVFGPLWGALYALVGAVLSAGLVHAAGRLTPVELTDRLLGKRGARLRARIVGHGLLAVAFVRLVPLAPYSVVSFVAGAARLPRFDYLAGTALGMLPGIALYALFVDRALAVIVDPHPLAWLGLLVAVVLIVAVALVLRALPPANDAGKEGT